MPETRLKCPSCEAVLKLSSPVAPGKAIKCPKCGAAIRAPAAALKSAAPAEASPQPAPRPQPPRAAKKPTPEEVPAEEVDLLKDDEKPAPRVKKRPRHHRSHPVSELSNLGLAFLIVGVAALGVALIPCMGFFSLPVSAIGAILGVTALVIARNKQESLGFPIAGTAISCVALAVPFVWVAVAAKVTSDAIKEEIDKPTTNRDKDRPAKDKERADPRNERLARERKMVRESEAMTVTQRELELAYQANEPAADRKYKDKVLEVQGKAMLIRRGSLVLESEDGAVGLVCDFLIEDQGPLATIKEGQKITVRGLGYNVAGHPALRTCYIK